MPKQTEPDPDAVHTAAGFEPAKILDGAAQAPEVVDINVPTHWPGNARQGDLMVVAESLKTNGQYKPILVHRPTGHVFVGNHTLEAARDILKWDKIAVAYHDIPEDEARAIAVVDNRASDMAGWDNEKLLAELDLIKQARAGADDPLAGTGFDQMALDGLLADLNGRPTGGSEPPQAPGEFPGFDDNIDTDYQCPHCGYEWSGLPRAAGGPQAAEPEEAPA